MNAKKEKFSGIALEMDVIKKMGHQLARLPNGRSPGVLEFVRGWSDTAAITDVPLSNNGQLSLAASQDAAENVFAQTVWQNSQQIMAGLGKPR